MPSVYVLAVIVGICAFMVTIVAIRFESEDSKKEKDW